MSNLFNKEYVNGILEPFTGKKLRMNPGDKIPFFLETNMEASFEMEIDQMGIKFILNNNYYIKRDLTALFSSSFHEIDIYPFQLDKLAGVESSGTNTVIFDKILEHVLSQFRPQIAYTYYGMIKSLCVDEKKFILNGIEFYITSN